MSRRLPALPKIHDLLKIYDITAKSDLSQNFILDKNVTDTIVAKAKIKPENSLVVEVGPGPGLLTRSLLDAGVKNLIAIERDERFKPLLSQLQDASEGRFTPIMDDALKIKHETIIEMVKDKKIDSVHIIGNLPFNIATSLLLSWLRMLKKSEGLLGLPNPSMCLMFQYEVGKRIASETDGRLRGRLSVMAQSLCQSQHVYTISPASFVPRPKVKGSLVRMTKLNEPLLQSSFESLENITRFLFSMRRKSIGSIIKHVDEDVSKYFKQANIELSDRPENISTKEMCGLAKVLEEDGINWDIFNTSTSRKAKNRGF
ncbi:hypothetical protein BB560_001227 [Smittium megazygosporum]|uniref:rRNA adenine N(6)-methyltransferase n=1 Tax=Smittium megazygosporum TaxID=133381 RepID=A0A2T9ZI70_9FUNG|nr:hypothetical protein BB560_001227 [Smittium megazygosporum]